MTLYKDYKDQHLFPFGDDGTKKNADLDKITEENNIKLEYGRGE